MEDCCAAPENRTAPSTPDLAKPELTVTVCEVCGRRHFELDVDALDLRGEAASL